MEDRSRVTGFVYIGQVLMVSSAVNWWLRSVNSSNTNNFRNVNTDGNSNNNNANNTLGVAPGSESKGLNQ